MSADIETRIGRVEASYARLDERMGHVERDVGKIGAGVDKLLQREASRGEPMSLKTILTTVAAVFSILAALGGFSWWFIATSPALLSMERRLDKLDDAQVGRVTRLERDTWSTKVTQGK